MTERYMAQPSFFSKFFLCTIKKKRPSKNYEFFWLTIYTKDIFSHLFSYFSFRRLIVSLKGEYNTSKYVKHIVLRVWLLLKDKRKILSVMIHWFTLFCGVFRWYRDEFIQMCILKQTLGMGLYYLLYFIFIVIVQTHLWKENAA